MKASFVSLLCLLIAGPAHAGVRGTYEVPVPEELREFARYELDDLRVRLKGNALEIRYELPLALTGVKNRLEFLAPIENGVAHTKNSSGEIRCQIAERTCRMKYQYISVSLSRVESILKAVPLPEPVIAARLKVSARFGGDMEGKLSFTGLEN